MSFWMDAVAPAMSSLGGCYYVLNFFILFWTMVYESMVLKLLITVPPYLPYILSFGMVKTWLCARWLLV